MPGTFTYTEATNKIEVTDGTSGAPATFNDMYTADQAGTGTFLLAAGPITDALDYQVRPTKDRAILLKIIVASKTAEADYVFLTGTDWRDAAQTESIDVSAGNGSYTTTKYWRTIDDPNGIDCSDNPAGGGTAWNDGTIAVTQDIWGVVWEYAADAKYQIDCNVSFGDDVTATHFTSVFEQVYFSDGIDYDVQIDANLQLGDKQDGYGVHGSSWSVKEINKAIYGSIYIYDSRIVFRSNGQYHWLAGVDVEILNSTFTSLLGGDRGYYFGNSGDLTIKRSNFLNLATIRVYRTGTMEDNLSHYNQVGASNYSTGDEITYDNFIISACTEDYVVLNAASQLTMKDPINSATTIGLYNATATAVEQYTCNIHIADEDGADLEAVSIACTTFGNVVSPDAGTTFYKCIESHTSGVWATDLAAEKWEVTTAAYAALAGCTGAAQVGAWVTSVPYVTSATEFTAIVTDSSGDIAEQTIDFKKWYGTSEALLTYSPHTFTLTYGGDTEVFEDFVVDHPVVWHLEYPPVATMLTAIYAKLPTNYIMGSSDVDDHDTDIDSILEDTATTIPSTIATVDANVDSILEDTGTTIPSTITTAQNDLDTITGGSGVLIDTDAVDADAIKADAVTEIQSGLATATNVTDAHTATDADIAVVDGVVDAILADTGTTLPATLASLPAANAAAIWATAMTDLAAGAPSATASVLTAVNYLYEAWRNRTVTEGDDNEVVVYRNDGVTKLLEFDMSHVGNVFDKGKAGAAD